MKSSVNKSSRSAAFASLPGWCLGRAGLSIGLRYGFLPGLAACGGGEVHITPMNPEFRPASGVIRALEQSETREEFAKELEALHGPKGDRLNWEEFWKLLAKSPARIPATRHFSETVFSLQRRDCNRPAFQAYVQFVRETQRGYEYLYDPAKRSCQTAMDPRDVIDFTQNAWSQVKVEPEPRNGLAALLLGWVVAEIGHGDLQAWRNTLTDENLFSLLPILEQRLNAQDAAGSAEFLSAIRMVVGHVPYQTFLQMRLFSNSVGLPEQFTASSGLDAYLELCRQVIPSQDEQLDLFLEGVDLYAIRRTIEILLNDPFHDIRLLDRAMGRYQKIKQILKSLTRRMPRTEGAVLLDRLYRHIGKWMAAQPQYLVRDFFDHSLKYVSNTARNLDLLWFVYLANAERTDLDWIRNRLRNVPSSGADIDTQVLLARLRFHLGESVQEKTQQLSHYCQILEEAGYPAMRWSATEIQEHVDSGRPLTAGCHWVTVREEKQNALHFKKAIQGATDSVMQIFSSPGFKLDGPGLSIGGLVLWSASQTTPSTIAFGRAWNRSVVFDGNNPAGLVVSTNETVPIGSEEDP